MTPDKAMDEQALRIDTQLCAEGKVATSAAYAIEFAHRLRAEWMAQQEPVAWKCFNLQTGAVVYIDSRPDSQWEENYDFTPLYAAPVAKPAAQDCVSVPREPIGDWLRDIDTDGYRTDEERCAARILLKLIATPNEKLRMNALFLLLCVARAAHAAIDNSEECPDDGCLLSAPWAKELDYALRALDALPELPNPYIGSGPAKAEYILKATLAASEPKT